MNENSFSPIQGSDFLLGSVTLCIKLCLLMRYVPSFQIVEKQTISTVFPSCQYIIHGYRVCEERCRRGGVILVSWLEPVCSVSSLAPIVPFPVEIQREACRFGVSDRDKYSVRFRQFVSIIIL